MTFDPCNRILPRIAPVPVDIPQWGEDGVPATVFVRSITAGERDAFEHAVMEARRDRRCTRIRSRLVSMTLCDGEGVRLMPAVEPSLAIVESWDAGPVELLFEAAAKLNRLLPEDAKALGET